MATPPPTPPPESGVPLEITADTKERLDKCLVRATGLSRAYLQEQIEQGAVTVQGRPVLKASHTLQPGDTLQCRFVLAPAPTLEAVDGHLHILWEDEHLLVLNKAQGTVVHPAPGYSGETLVHYLLHHLRDAPDLAALGSERPGIVHRLDRGTSGAIVVAKSRSVQEALSSQFKERTVSKQYEAIVWGTLPGEGIWRDAIGRHPSDRKKWSSRTSKGRPAETRWRCAAHFAHFTHVALFPKTGRTHQLRVHLTEAGYPIVGDALYGSGPTPHRLAPLTPAVAQWAKSQRYTHLHARLLAFTHPVKGDRITVEAPRPPGFSEALALLAEEDPCPSPTASR